MCSRVAGIGLLGVVMVSQLVGCAGSERGGLEPGAADASLEVIARHLPDELDGWRAEDAGQVPTIYDTESIYQYIDGHAEVYLAYGMTGCLARRYLGPEGEPDLVLDVFELASPADAYGVVSHQAQGEPVAIGQGGRIRPGWISFWKGSYFVSAFAEDETAAATAALRRLAGETADAIPETGAEPELVGLLPAAGLDRDSVVFLRHHVVLAAHLASAVELAAEPVLGLDAQTGAVLARYHRGASPDPLSLLVVEYPDPRAAARAASRVRRVLGGEVLQAGEAAGASAPADELVARDERGTWRGVRQLGRALVLVVDASQKEQADAMLDEVCQQLTSREHSGVTGTSSTSSTEESR